MGRKTVAAKWSDSDAGLAAYIEARVEAQTSANADGFDRGVEANELFRHFRIFMLPRRENRWLFELRYEVVSTERQNAQSGHGRVTEL